MSGAPDPQQQRISDDDRHRVAEVLRDAAGEGRLDLDELDERLEAAYAAKVYADLVPLVIDLPAGPAHLPGPTVAATPDLTKRPASPTRPAADLPPRSTSLAVMSGQSLRGAWVVGETHQAFVLMGGIDIDLREAVFTSPEVVITASAVMGGIEIVVDARTRVAVEGIGVMGGFEQAHDRVEPEYDAGSPLVRVRGFALMGGVTVTRKGPPDGKRRRPPALP